MKALNISSIILFSLLFAIHLSCVEPKPAPENDESMVPEDIDDGAILDEDEPQAQNKASKVSSSAIDEYMKEHPEVKQLPTNGMVAPGQMKRVYNKFGDVISIPDPNAANWSKLQSKTPQNGQIPQQIPQQMLPNPFPYPPPYPYPMNPYFNQFGIPGQQQGYMQMPGPPQQPPQQQPPQQPPPPGSPVTPEELAKYQLKPNTGSEDQTKSETEVNEKIFQMMRSQQMPQNGNNGSVKGQSPPLPGTQPLPQMQPMMSQMMPQMMQPFPQPYPPFQTFYNPNQYQIDSKNIKIMPIPFPNGPPVDPNILQRIQSGSAQLDMAHAKIVPMEPIVEPTTEEPTPATESESLDERPELPEVVLPKPKPTRRPKSKRVGRRHSRHPNKVEVRKPHFLMRARLNKLPKKGENGTDEWWTKPVPEYCKEAIFEITNCADKHMMKRWSFNVEDEKCYLYEDLCYKIKKNTFKSLKDCMTECWRPK